MDRYLDTTLSPEERAEDLLAKMSAEEKLAQLTGVFAIRKMDEKQITHGIGQVSTLAFREELDSDEVAKWQKELQKKIIEKSPHGIPAVFHMEGLCGAFIKGTTAFPSGINRGASFDAELEEKIGEVVSRQEAAYGITQILAPVLDISRDSRMGRQCEPYGEDPTLSAAMGTAFTEGIQSKETAGRKTESVAKHFFGFHNSHGGIHGANVDAGDRLLLEVYGKPFQAAISKAGLKGVMPCYSSVNGLPIHASRHYLTDILRGEMGFEGVVVSDYSAVDNVYEVQKVCDSRAEAGEKCLKAGMDVELPMPSCFNADMLKSICEDEQSRAALDMAVKRVLTAKFRMGLFEHPYALEGSELYNVVNKETDDELAKKSAKESIILLKNDGILPLSAKGKKIAVIGPHAVNARYFFGGYTHVSMLEAARAAMNSMAGIGEGGDVKNAAMKRIPGTNIQDDESPEFNDILRELEPDCRNLLDTLTEEYEGNEILFAQGYYKAGSDEAFFDEALELVKKSDVVIMTLGGKNGSGSIATMGEGIDGTDIGLPGCQERFIEEAFKLGKPMIGIHFDGRPISSDVADNCLNAIIEAFSPATYTAEAVTDIIAGKYNPSGRLPVSVARSAGQIPIYYNHPNGSAWHQGPSIGFKDYVDMPHTPRYVFGYGLSYSKFDYSDINVSKNVVDPSEEFEVDFTVTNNGKVAGTEVAQMYLQDIKASMTRPVKELQGFARVSLNPGETKRVVFRVNPSQMAFLDENMKWKIEAGDIAIQIGASSEDIRLTSGYTVSGSKYIDGKDREFFSTVRSMETV